LRLEIRRLEELKVFNTLRLSIEVLAEVLPEVLAEVLTKVFADIITRLGYCSRGLNIN